VCKRNSAAVCCYLAVILERKRRREKKSAHKKKKEKKGQEPKKKKRERLELLRETRERDSRERETRDYILLLQSVSLHHPRARFLSLSLSFSLKKKMVAAAAATVVAPMAGAALINEALIAYGYVATWIGLSSGVILFNKYILSFFGFPFPISLTMIHMCFCSALAFLIIRVFKLVQSNDLDRQTYVQKIVPVGALFALSLWLSNTAYVYLSVAFIQMLKALMPASVYTVGCLMGIEQFTYARLVNMLVITLGVCIASYGELNFHLLGVLIQLASVCAEAFRLGLVQIILNSEKLKMNSITTLYYVSPACFVFLLIPFTFLEVPKYLDENTEVNTSQPHILFLNACTAFALNMAVYLLIGKTSALTMNVAGVVKDWLLIFISSALFDAPITKLQLFGYGISFVAVCYYNYSKYKDREKAMSMPKMDAKSEDGRSSSAEREMNSKA